MRDWSCAPCSTPVNRRGLPRASRRLWPSWRYVVGVCEVVMLIAEIVQRLQRSR